MSIVINRPILLQLGLVCILAFYVAWNLGANDVANSMGTSVGAKVITLRQALLVAGILEFTGAVLFGNKVATTLATEVDNPALFADTPQLLLLGMVAVLISTGLWLQIATSQGLPVASSHAVVGAIAGFSWVVAGVSAVDWQSLGRICLAWLLTPVIGGAIAALFYSILRRWLLNAPQPLIQLREWIPWLSSILLGIFGVIVLPSVFAQPWFEFISLPSQSLALGFGGVAAIGLTLFSWQQLNYRHRQTNLPAQQVLEGVMGKFQVFSACGVAFAHGSNDVGNAIAPLAAIVYILKTNSVPLDEFTLPIWILLLGGFGIVIGLAIQGKNVISTVGEGIIPLSPSSGFSAEIATATTILFASRLGLPVSTSHALVGSLIGIGLLEKSKQVRWQTLKSVFLAWVITLPAAAAIAAVSFSLLRLLSNY